MQCDCRQRSAVIIEDFRVKSGCWIVGDSVGRCLQNWGFAPGWLWVAELWRLTYLEVISRTMDALGRVRCDRGS